jgi:hypothetical protein
MDSAATISQQNIGFIPNVLGQVSYMNFIFLMQISLYPLRLEQNLNLSVALIAFEILFILSKISLYPLQFLDL